MKLLIDTNVIMDVLIAREPFLTDSRYVMELCKEQDIQGYVAAHTMTNLFYMLHKYYPTNECRNILLAVLDIFSVLSIDERKIRTALQNENFKNFEDCLQAECGQEAKVDYIVTRNAKDFGNSEIPCLSPGEVRNLFPQEA